jgi:hypothetical protein
MVTIMFVVALQLVQVKQPNLLLKLLAEMMELECVLHKKFWMMNQQALDVNTIMN